MKNRRGYAMVIVLLLGTLVTVIGYQFIFLQRVQGAAASKFAFEQKWRKVQGSLQYLVDCPATFTEHGIDTGSAITIAAAAALGRCVVGVPTANAWDNTLATPTAAIALRSRAPIAAGTSYALVGRYPASVTGPNGSPINRFDLTYAVDVHAVAACEVSRVCIYARYASLTGSNTFAKNPMSGSSGGTRALDWRPTAAEAVVTPICCAP